MTARYHIIDEPKPGVLSHFVVDSFWPLLATMLVGIGFGLGWLVFNAWAVGSPTRIRETLICIGGFVAAFVALLLTGALGIDGAAERYAFLVFIVIKLAAAYWATFLQQPSIEIHEYFGGKKQNGTIVLLAAMFGLRRLLADLPDGMIWLRVLVL